MGPGLAKLRIQKPENFKPPVREINFRIAKIRKEWGMSFVDIALKLDDGTTAEQLKKHFENDSGSSLVLAKLCRLFGLPYWEPEEIATSRVIDTIIKEILVRGWTRKMFARKMFPGVHPEEFGRYLNRVYKFFDDRSTNAFMLARAREVFKKPTVASHEFLTEADRKEMTEKIQLELSL